MPRIDALDTDVFYRATNVAVGPSSDAEVTLIEQTIPGGVMGANGVLRCLVGGDFLNNMGATRTFTLRVYCGGVKVYDGASSAAGSSAARRAISMLLLFANRGAANSNLLHGQVGVGNASAPTTGVSTVGNGLVSGPIASDVTSVDTSADWTFKVTVQLSAAEANLDMRVAHVLLEVL